MRIDGTWIRDDQGRALILRGCNLGGSGKIPSVENKNENANANANALSFAGKPFPIEEADERFAELARWGLRFNRLVVPWEAVEHDGPGIYDEAYLAYLRKLLLAAEKRGVALWIDPHQDVWGRTAGGDGAPSWTVEALGIDPVRLEAAGAILPSSVRAITPPDRRPLMTWPAGNNRYAAATMFTLFFAGNAFAPETRIEEGRAVAGGGGESVEDWLQTRYIEAFAHARRRLKNCRAVAGWGTMNEPHPGFAGYKDIRNLENNMVAVGPMPGPFAAMTAASGHAVEIPVYATGVLGARIKGRTVLNPRGVSVFRDGFACPWKTAGVWDDSGGEPRLLRPGHFALYRGRPVRFAEDFLVPFINRFIRRLGEADEKTLFFVEGVPSGLATGDDVPPNGPVTAESPRRVNAFHWYDGPTLFIKQWRSWFNYDVKRNKIVLGRRAVDRLYRETIAGHIRPGMPNLAGEFGLPFDLFKGRAFKTGDYRIHEEALDRYYAALDEFLLGAAIWDYSADNTWRWGDLWNNEDFSIVTTGDGAGPLRPRAAGGWLRPYPLATAGTPRFFRWDRKKRRLVYRYHAGPAVAAPTALYIPAAADGGAPRVTISAAGENAGTAAAPVPEGIRTEHIPERQELLVYHGDYGGELEIRVECS